MTRANIRVINDSKPAKYFFQVANLIDDMGLSVYAYRLYLRLVRISSLRNALSSTRGLAKACNMSAGSISNAKAELVKAELISIVKKPSGRGEDYDEIHILDITARNVAHCETLRLSSSGELSEDHSSPHELISSSGERDSSSHERNSSSGEQVGITVQQHEKKEEITKEESGASAPAPAPSSGAPADTLPASNPPAAETPQSESGSGVSDVTITETPRGAGVIITLKGSAPDNDSAGAPSSSDTGSSNGKSTTKRGGKKSPANFTEHEDTRVQWYLDRILPEITPSNAEIIMKRVCMDYLEQWEEALLKHATGNGRGSAYKLTDFVILFDLYERAVTAKKAEKAYAEMMTKRQQSSAPAAKPAAVSPLHQRLQERGITRA